MRMACRSQAVSMAASVPVLAPVLVLVLALGSLVGADAAASLKIRGQGYQRGNGQIMTVRVTNTEAAQGDVIGLYQVLDPTFTPAQTVANQTVVKFIYPAELDASYLTNKVTDVDWYLPNYRTDLVLYLFKGATFSGRYGGWFLAPFIVASTKIINRVPNEFTQGHLGLTGITDTHAKVVVQWTTKNWVRPAIRWGFSYRRLGRFIRGDRITYTRDEMCGPPANTTGWRNPGSLNYAKFDAPLGRKIFYQYGSLKTGRFSFVYSFHTPPRPNSRDPTNIIWIADYGNTNPDGADQFGINSATTVYRAPPTPGKGADASNAERWLTQASYLTASNQMEQGSSGLTASTLLKEVTKANAIPYHAMMISGDLSYARGFLSQWEQFWAQTSPIAKRVPVLPGMGNHERNAPHTGGRFEKFAQFLTPEQYEALEEDSGGECGIVTLKRFLAPPPFTPEDPKTISLPDTPWYSLNIGNIHYIQYSSEHEVAKGSPQYAFLEADLMSVDRKKTPFLVVGGHRCVHVSTLDGVIPTSDLATGQDTLVHLEDLFYLYEVDLVLHGHHHTYQRTYPVYKRNITEGAPVYVVAGNAGFQLTLYVQPNPPDYFKVIRLDHGWLKIIATRTKLTCTVRGQLAAQQWMQADSAVV